MEDIKELKDEVTDQNEITLEFNHQKTEQNEILNNSADKNEDPELKQKQNLELIEKRNQYLMQVNCQNSNLWKQTMTGEYIPIKLFQLQDKEIVQKKLKTSQKVEDILKDYLKLKINDIPSKTKTLKNKEQLYHVKVNVLSRSLNEYVQIKSFDKEKLVYQAKVLALKNNQDKEKEDVREFQQDDLTKQIEIQIDIVTLSGQLSDDQQAQFPNQKAIFKININEKISKIISLLQACSKDTIDGDLYYKGKFIELPQEETFDKQHVKNQDKFQFIMGSESFKEPQIWQRFEKIYITDYYYMNSSYYDAVAFKPLRDIVFFGFGVFANYHDKNLHMKIQWAIGDEHSQEYEKEFQDSEKNQEKKWFIVDIREFGEKGIKVSEGTLIHCKVKLRDDNNTEERRQIYGYEGYKHNYSKLEGQDYDFDMEYSSHNQNSTNESWGNIPFIYYA